MRILIFTIFAVFVTNAGAQVLTTPGLPVFVYLKAPVKLKFEPAARHFRSNNLLDFHEPAVSSVARPEHSICRFGTLAISNSSYLGEGRLLTVRSAPHIEYQFKKGSETFHYDTYRAVSKMEPEDSFESPSREETENHLRKKYSLKQEEQFYYVHQELSAARAPSYRLNFQGTITRTELPEQDVYLYMDCFIISSMDIETFKANFFEVLGNISVLAPSDF